MRKLPNTPRYAEEPTNAELQEFASQPQGDDADYYQLPPGAKQMQDLIEYREMNFARGNIFKAIYRLGRKGGTSDVYDLQKIIWYAKRELELLKAD